MNNKSMTVKDIEELAEVYLNRVYPTGCDNRQWGESKQHYLAGFFEGLQLTRGAIAQNKPESVDSMFKELKDYFYKRTEELTNLNK